MGEMEVEYDGVVKVLLQVFNISPEIEHAEDGHNRGIGTIYIWLCCI